MLRGPCMAPYAKADAKRAARASLLPLPAINISSR